MELGSSLPGGDREKTGVPGHDWARKSHTKVSVGNVSAMSPVTNVSNRV